MPPAMTLLGALSVPALLVLREMESTVQVRLVEMPPQSCVDFSLQRLIVLKYKLRFLEVFTYTIFTKLLCTNQKSS